jgi:hypothetical protein
MQKHLLATRDDMLAKRNDSVIFADNGCAWREPPETTHQVLIFFVTSSTFCVVNSHINVL